MSAGDPASRSLQLAKLREAFRPDAIGKLPRITCTPCSQSQSKVCGQHAKTRCQDCGNWITAAHLHLDYVGHADVTDRLLDVDPEWTWEPVPDPAAAGLPVTPGGLWIRLTVAGVTRLGYGDAGQKKGSDAIKETIGDAIRNAAMRFGVALDLWAKGDRAWATAGGASLDASQPATQQPAAAAVPVDNRPPEQVEADAIREQILAFATTYRREPSAIATSFASDHGVPIQRGTPAQLEAFYQDLLAEAAAEQVAS